MALDPSIILAGQQRVQPVSYGDSLAKIMGLRQDQQALQMNDMRIRAEQQRVQREEQERQRAVAEQQATSAALQQAYVKGDDGVVRLNRDLLRQAGASNPALIPFVEKALEGIETRTSNRRKLATDSLLATAYDLEALEFNPGAALALIDSLTQNEDLHPREAALYRAQVEQGGPEAVKKIAAQWQLKAGKAPPKMIAHDPEKDLILEGTGEIIRKGTPKPIVDTRSLQLQANAAQARGDQAEYQRLLRVIKETGQADDRPLRQLAPIVIMTPTGPQTVNRGTNTATPVTDATGAPIGPTPSAMERMDARKFQKAAPVLSAIDELSAKINTQQGLLARMSGGAAKLKAKANYDDDVAEYQSLVSGFTPMVARALGHTGVLTQQDVDSVKALFPLPGDSKTLRDRKLARMNQIVGALESADGGGAKADPMGLR